jgi:predicted nuclease of predicted toxin-antitoxin system
MKWLSDQNISYDVVRQLHDFFSGCTHLSNAGLSNASDNGISSFAKVNGNCIMTFDYDFVDFSALKVLQPKS